MTINRAIFLCLNDKDPQIGSRIAAEPRGFKGSILEARIVRRNISYRLLGHSMRFPS